jgi:predicted RNA-binding protein with PIN domain
VTEPTPWAGPLPDDVRERVLVLASETLGSLSADQVPPRLRAVARFAPSKRARLGASHLASALDNDPAFRARVVARAREGVPDLVEALEQGHAPAAGDPADVAAVAWLVNVPGWEEQVRRAEEARASRGGGSEALAELERLRDQLAAARTQSRTEVAEARTLADGLKAALTAAQREVRELKGSTRAAERRAEEASSAADAAVADARRQVATAEAEARRLKARLAEVEEGAGSARRASREGRSAAEVRLRLLLDTVVDGAQGLRRELALPPLTEGARPADLVADDLAEAGAASADVRARSLASDEHGRLDQLLALPQVHLVIDGYNVTKTGYGSLPLEGQRQRLLTRLGALAAQTGAEVTVVFDGAALDGPTPTGSPRGVRTLFSPSGTTADTVIRRLVRAEPAGRAVVVVSSDREVSDGVRAAGAWTVPSATLLRRLDRS